MGVVISSSWHTYSLCSRPVLIVASVFPGCSRQQLHKRVPHSHILVSQSLLHVQPFVACPESCVTAGRYLCLRLHSFMMTAWMWTVGGNLSKCHFAHHKSHTDWPGIKPGQPWWEAGEWPYHVTCSYVISWFLDSKRCQCHQSLYFLACQ
jgi:hypothetical protein